MKSLTQTAYDDVAELIDKQTIQLIDNIIMGQPTQDTNSELEVVAKARLENLKQAELKEFEAERKAFLAKEGDRVVSKDARILTPTKHELTDEEVCKQAEETEKWATQFLKEK